MFSTELSTILALFGASSLMVAAILFYIIRRMSQRVSAAITYLHTQNKNSVSLRRLAEVEATLVELSDSYEALLKSVRKLGARLRMRANRQNGVKEPELPENVPAEESERAAYKAKLREKLRKEGRL
jgi:hypothetical protein